MQETAVPFYVELIVTGLNVVIFTDLLYILNGYE